MSEGKCEVVKADKHSDLVNAIDNIDSILHAVEGLYEKIVDTTPEDKPCDERKRTSLAKLLEEGPERLHKVTEDIHKVINDINERLF